MAIVANSNKYYTIGHSNMPVTDFVDILQSVRIEHLIDVRKFPRSRSNPQYNIDSLPLSLSEYQIEYMHISALGGRRGRQANVADSVNGLWRNSSFHNYADYAMSPEFRSGLNQLRDLGRQKQCAIMCAEALWWRCHRRIITDYLIAAGDQVFHIFGKDHIDEAHMTIGVQPQSDGSLTYPCVPETGERLRVEGSR
jgi:uncharacterized protein (DUF488 family)